MGVLKGESPRKNPIASSFIEKGTSLAKSTSLKTIGGSGNSSSLGSGGYRASGWKRQRHNQIAIVVWRSPLQHLTDAILKPSSGITPRQSPSSGGVAAEGGRGGHRLRNPPVGVTAIPSQGDCAAISKLHDTRPSGVGDSLEDASQVLGGAAQLP